MAEKKIGTISTFFTKINVAAIELVGPLKVGDTIHIKGHTTDFNQKVESMQIEMKDIEKAKKGDSVGIKVKDRVRPSDVVFMAE